jgi:ABC-type multidrug transport system permease subunit
MNQKTLVWYTEYFIGSITYLYIGLIVLNRLEGAIWNFLYILLLPVYMIALLSIIGNLESSTQDIEPMDEEVEA